MQGGSVVGRESRRLGGFALDFESGSSTLSSIPRLGLPQLGLKKQQPQQPLFSLTTWKVFLGCKQMLPSGPPSHGPAILTVLALPVGKCQEE